MIIEGVEVAPCGGCKSEIHAELHRHPQGWCQIMCRRCGVSGSVSFVGDVDLAVELWNAMFAPKVGPATRKIANAFAAKVAKEDCVFSLMVWPDDDDGKTVTVSTVVAFLAELGMEVKP